jgi:LysR family transcriptional regulator, low CO2-responsive transcriptional regulator
MRLTQLRSFHAVARTGGFTGGARLLHISQPTVTTQVRFLEQTYGIELFYRRGHKVALTPLGEQLYAITQKIFALEGETLHLLSDSGQLKSGHLRVGAVGPFHVTEMLAEFNKRYPDMQVSVRVGNSESVLQTLVNYETDVAVLAQFSNDPRFHFVPYRRHPVVIFVHRSHRFAGRKSLRIRDLQGEEMILREVGSTTRKALEEALEQHNVAPRVLMEIGSREAIREAVIKGVGIGAVSEIEYIPDPALRVLRVRDADMFTHAHVVCLEERRGARLVKAFLEIVEDLQRAAGARSALRTGAKARRA